MTAVWLDIETRGRIDVTKAGLYRHAEGIEKILCARYAFDDGEVLEWRGAFADGADYDCADDPPADLIEAVMEPDALIFAHNAAYERIILRECCDWWPEVPLEAYICTAAWAATFNLPRALGQLSRALLPSDRAKMVLFASQVKFMWSSDKATGAGADMDIQSDYCGRDVEAMREIMALLPPVDPNWLADYHASERINDRGVMLDLDLAAAVATLKPEIEDQLQHELDEATGGKVKLRGPSLMRWLEGVLPEDTVTALDVVEKKRVGYGFKSIVRRSAGKAAREQLLAAIHGLDGFGNVRRALTAYETANAAAVHKYGAALTRASEDGALRGQFVMNGAAQTGRYTSTGVQLHNTIREVHGRAGEVIEALTEAAELGLSEAETVGGLQAHFGETINSMTSKVLRPMLVAEAGKTLTWSDWSSIEAMVLPWLSDRKSAERVLDVFRRGGDLYVETAAGILRKAPGAVTPNERQSYGKLPVLSCGYGGGVNAILAFAAGYKLDITRAEAERIRDEWREANPWAQQLWRHLEAAAINAVMEGGDIQTEAGRIRFQYAPTLVGGTLLAWLPGGGWIAWPRAEVLDLVKFEDGPVVPTLTFQHPVYGPSTTYGGKLAENVTQAVAAWLLRRAMQECGLAGLDAVAHVHDEVLCESTERRVSATEAQLKRIMETVPEGFAGLPLACEVSSGWRYKMPGSVDPGVGRG